MHRLEQTRMIEISAHSAPLIHGALRDRVAEVQEQYETIKISAKRDLTDEERAKLPSTLMNATTAELRDQIDSWYSYVGDYQYWMNQFDVSLWPQYKG